MKKLFVFFIFLFINDCIAKNSTYSNLFKEYINNTETIKSNFIQFDKNSSSMSEGIFYLKKPDKVRFEYTHPFRTLLIANGRVLTYYDIDLDEISTIPTKNTPINVFLNFDLEKINIIDTKNNGKNVIIETSINVADVIYYVNYTFDKDIKNLISINFKNEDEELDIDFFETELNTELDKKIFTFKSPRLYKRK